MIAPEQVYVVGFVTDGGTGGFDWNVDRETAEGIRKVLATPDTDVTEVLTVVLPGDLDYPVGVTDFLSDNPEVWEPVPGSGRFVIAGMPDDEGRMTYWCQGDDFTVWGHLVTAVTFTAAEAGDGNAPTGLADGDNARWVPLQGHLGTVRKLYVDEEGGEGFAELGIPTDYACENHCLECGDHLNDGGYVEVPGEDYDRPDWATVGVHPTCLAERQRETAGAS